jgi:hypothetical protein
MLYIEISIFKFVKYISKLNNLAFEHFLHLYNMYKLKRNNSNKTIEQMCRVQVDIIYSSTAGHSRSKTNNVSEQIKTVFQVRKIKTNTETN